MKQKRYYSLAAAFLTAFALFTLAVCTIDVQPIGPRGSTIGFAALNRAFHAWTGVHMKVYIITDWLGLVPVAFGLGFAVLGLWQWVRRKQLWRVDRSLLALGVFYLAVLGVYLLFETAVVNYRPILIDGYPEASYPSSTTLLALCVMPTAAMQLRERLHCRAAEVAIYAFTAFMVIGRLISGVHWLSDIIGGILLSAGLIALYRAACKG